MPVAEEFSRTAALLGENAVERLSKCRVAVCGLGGVGSYTAEALARTGVGELVLIDGDRVTPSNINRQLYALHSTVSMPKTQVAAERIHDINPKIVTETHFLFLESEIDPALFEGCDVIIDAIDTVRAKVAIAKSAKELKIPLISAMGCGNKLDPTQLEVADIFSTSICPLCRVMRHELRKAGIDSLKVVYSKEPPHAENPLNVPSSTVFVPASAGLILAAETVNIIHNIYY